MIRNYIITAFRNLYKNKGFSTINILGLSVGLASFLLISLYVYHELSFDQFHDKKDRIYRIVENLRTENELLFQSVSSPPMGPALANEFPEIENYVRFTNESVLVRKGDKTFYEEDCLLADSTVFDVFSFKLLKGDKRTALTQPKTTVLSVSTAKKYFGDEDPIGQSLNMSGDEFKVTGIVEDVPENSHFRFDILLSFSTWSSGNKEAETKAWFWNGFHTYLLLKEGTDIEAFRKKIPSFIDRKVEKGDMYYEDLPLQSLGSIYLETPRSWENGKRGSLNNLYILSAIALFTLLIACFNYINLATARASRRLKEVGLRKVLGAQRRMLIAQFLSESLIISTLATLLGLGMAWLAFPAFNTLATTHLHFGILPSPVYLWGILASIALVLGLLSGAYPAFMISGFEPLQIFRPSFKSIFGHNFLRQVLVSIQFVISICLLAGTLLVFNQLELMRDADLGFKKEATLVLHYNGQNVVRDHLESIREEMKTIAGISTVTASHSVPGQSTTNLFSSIEMKNGKMSPTNINTNFVDHDFLSAYAIPLVAGRNFSREFPADDTTAFIVNETAVKDFGLTASEAIGKKIDQNGKKGTIIGVVKDFHYRSLHHPVEPLMLTINKWAYSNISIRIETKDVHSTVNAMETKWKSLTSDLPFRYSFLDQDYNELYQADVQLGKIAGLFGALAIFVGCLGLLGLTSFSVDRRVKEIGIRKALGATAGNVIFMISKEFVRLIIISFIVAIPVTYYMISKWLDHFTNRIVVGPFSFIVAGLAVLTIAWLTVSFLSFKAAATNPGVALRNE